jgi:presenilin-like A22 family membrane protease
MQTRRVNCLPRPGSYRLCPVVVEVARGHSGSPYASLGAIAGLAYILAVALFRRRG